ncbi:MAG: RcpC/CpaB family pilus assembly protein [Streptosporangiaceae bacterium]
MLTIVLAALLAVVGAVAVLAYVRQANHRAIANLNTETVLQATGTIPEGTTLGQAESEKLLSTQQVPQGSLSGTPVQIVTKKNQGQVAATTIGKGTYLVTEMLESHASLVASGNFTIPTGMDAVTIQVCLSQAVAGYVVAGSYVSVFDTTTVKKGVTSVQQSCDVSHQATYVANSVSTRIVLVHALVLAVGQSPSSQGTSSGIAAAAAEGPAGQTNPPVLVTLAVSQADTERLIFIDEVGLPYMALLSPASKPTYDTNTPPVLFRTPPP